MRVRTEVDKSLVDRIDEAAGGRGRSEFVRRALVAAPERSERIRFIHSAKGAIADTGHDWDAGAAEWVHMQRRIP
jgi:hypothetical protein